MIRATESGSQKTRVTPFAKERLSSSDLTRLGIREALETLSRKAYPSFTEAFETRASINNQIKASLLDWARNHGPLMESQCAAYPELLADPTFVEELHKAYESGSKVDDIEVDLVENWKLGGYCEMQDAELAAIVNEKFGTEIKPRTLAKRAERLGLTTDRQPGPKPRFG